MSYFKKSFISFLICISFIIVSPVSHLAVAKADTIGFVILSKYKANVNIGEEFYILAFTSNAAIPSWKSSSKKIASVNSYGKVTAKSAGTATITAKIKNGEASCKVTVKKTRLTISDTSISIERGEDHHLTATTSNQSTITWKSSKKSVAVVDEYGVVTGRKPGETIITAKADGTSKTCQVKVKSPTIRLNRTKIKIYRGQTAKLTASISSTAEPKWKSNKKSVAVVDETGTITAIKHGTAIITVTADGISRSCEVTVKSPVITLNAAKLSLEEGSEATLTAHVSSGNSVVWKSSNDTVASVNAFGVITAWKKGKATIYASEDGAKVRCRITVTKSQEK